MRHRCEALNKLDLKALRYTCENGTDLLLELDSEGHIWLGGEESSKDGTIFNANSHRGSFPHPNIMVLMVLYTAQNL